jgi:hypothetical protein
MQSFAGDILLPTMFEPEAIKYALNSSRVFVTICGKYVLCFRYDNEQSSSCRIH